MWNNGTREIIYDYYKIGFVMIIYGIIILNYDQTHFTIIDGKQCYKENHLWEL